MEAECFGGEETAPYSQYPRASSQSQPGTNGGGGGGGALGGPSSSWKRERTRNAFLLVYDRVLPQDHARDEVQQQQQPSGERSRVDTSSVSSSGGAPSGVRSYHPPEAKSVIGYASPRRGVPRDAAPSRGAGADKGRGEGARRQQRRQRRRRKRFKAKVPGIFLQQIWRENVEFWRWEPRGGRGGGVTDRGLPWY